MRGLRTHLTFANIAAGLALVIAIAGGTAYAANTVFSTDIVNGEVKTPDLAAAAVTTAKIATAGVTASDLAPDSVSGNKVVSNSLSGTDVNESTLATVPAATSADKLDGKDAAQLGSARIHLVGEEQSDPLPEMHVAAFCSGNPQRDMRIHFDLPGAGTANVMAVANGIDPAPTTQPGWFNLANGAQAVGKPFAADPSFSSFSIIMNDHTGSAQAEAQVVIDSGGKTYSIALHMYDQQDYCETFGTVTVAE